MIVKFEVKGLKPCPQHNYRDRLAWREKIASAARGRKVRKLRKRDALFAVDLTFRFHIDRVLKGDLDNLAKPVIDTLFRIRSTQKRGNAPTGALFDVDDARVVRLHLEKTPVLTEEEEGLEVVVAYIDQRWRT